MGMFTMCPACGSDWCVNCECVREAMQKEVDALKALLRESRRPHDHCDDSYYCCGKCEHSDHGSLVGEDRVINGRGGECTCGADAWNARVDAALVGGAAPRPHP